MNSSSPMRTRIAPSPTGNMHIGTLRTVLYDYFLARQSCGQFILRIEDTDRERLVPGTMESLLKTFATLGLDYDEGPVLAADGSITSKGESGPYIQSERLDVYRGYAEQLLKEGHAYPCFCTEERLKQMREEQMALKQASKYDRHCLSLSKTEVDERLARGEAHVLRMKIPEGASSFEDGIRGEITFQNAEVDDQILMKSDGFPTYHLAVVVDDYLMKITHVLRGEEWISSTPKQIILHQMFGWTMPVYSHVPLILNPDKTKLSKRKGDVSVESYLQKGYLPEALINFLALLGWNPTDDREVYELSELIQLFDLKKVNRAGAVMNMEKLNWMNNHYLRAIPEERYLQICLSVVRELHTDEAFLRRACLIVRERLQLPSELPALLDFFFHQTLEQDPTMLVWKTQTKEEARVRLQTMRDFLATQEEAWFAEVVTIDVGVRGVIAEHAWSNGEVLWPLRVALSGSKQSPSPFELLFAYGKERALARIDEALTRLA